MNGKNKLLIVGLLVGVVLVMAGLVLVTRNDNDVDDMGSKTSQSTSSNQPNPSESSASKAEATTTVEVKDFAFTPATIRVKVGDTVTWTNQDSMRHDVVMDDSNAEGPASELLEKGESYSYTFTKAGTYAYHCSPHPYMKGTVVVEE